MSPTTLYREGSDLDELLAELDSRYPGQVRVVEVTHPREGGVMGFFAKQRVGVHYRLIEAPAAPRQTVISQAAPAIPAPRRTRTDVPERTAAAAYDAAAEARTAGPGAARGGVGGGVGIAERGFGPDLAAIRAALAHRSGGRRGSSTTAGDGPSRARGAAFGADSSATSGAALGTAFGTAAGVAPGAAEGGAGLIPGAGSEMTAGAAGAERSPRNEQGTAPSRESSFDRSLPHLESTRTAETPAAVLTEAGTSDAWQAVSDAAADRGLHAGALRTGAPGVSASDAGVSGAGAPGVSASDAGVSGAGAPGASAPDAGVPVTEAHGLEAPGTDMRGPEAPSRREAGQAGDPGLEFAKILADIAFQKSVAPGGGDIAADLAAVVAALQQGSLAASDAEAASPASVPAADVVAPAAAAAVSPAPAMHVTTPATAEMASVPATDATLPAAAAADFTPLDGFATLLSGAWPRDLNAASPAAAPQPVDEARPLDGIPPVAGALPGRDRLTAGAPAMDDASDPGSAPAQPMGAASPADTAAIDAATAGAPRRRKPRAVPKFLGCATAPTATAATAISTGAASAPEPAGQAATRQAITHQAAIESAGTGTATRIADPSPAVRSAGAPAATAPAPAATAAALSAAATAARRTDHLNWPFATTAAAAVTAQATTTPTADASAAVEVATTTVPRPAETAAAVDTDEALAAAPRQAAVDCPTGHGVVGSVAGEPAGFAAAGPAATATLMSASAGTTVAQRIAETDRAVAASASTRRHELRRRLIEIGVPIATVPTDADHAYAAVETLVHELAPAPALPSGAGQIVVLAGPARDVALTADALAAAPGRSFDAIWSYGCPAGLGTWRVNLSRNALTSAAEARNLARTLRAEAAGTALVLVATDAPSFAEPPVAVLDALTPDAVWAVVDATRKPGDTRKGLSALGHLDAIAVTGAEASGSPATVWDLGLPIAMVDGRPSTASAWAVLLVGKLSEIAEAEEMACSAAAS